MSPIFAFHLCREDSGVGLISEASDHVVTCEASIKRVVAHGVPEALICQRVDDLDRFSKWESRFSQQAACENRIDLLTVNTIFELRILNFETGPH